MSFTKIMKQRSKELQIKRKQEHEEYKSEQERQMKLTSDLIHYNFQMEREYVLNREKELQKEYDNKISFLDIHAKTLPYKLWLTLRDIINNDYFQIESDLSKGKISQNELDELRIIASQYKGIAS